MFSNVKADLKVNYSTLSKISCINYRLGSYSYKNNNLVLMLIYKLSNFLTRIITGSDISALSQIGKGLRLEHGGQGVVIHSSAIIGENARIFHQTTIGIAGKTKIEKAAKIGNNVLIGTGAKIIGEITIGDNVKIGANAVVLESVPSNSIAVGIPAKVNK